MLSCSFVPFEDTRGIEEHLERGPKDAPWSLGVGGNCGMGDPSQD